MTDLLKLQQILEALLLASGKPMSLERLAALFDDNERPDQNTLLQALGRIQESCEDRGFELKKVASGYRFQVRQSLSPWVGRLWEEKPQRYSRAMLETLAIIAYRQPLTRGDIEKIRGVAVSSSLIHTLLEREWVRVVGHRDVPGRPAMYATTRQFLDYFNLESLQQLPALSEIRDLEEINRELSLEEGVPQSRVLDLPGEEEAGSEALEEDDAALSEAVAKASRPLEEIIAYGGQDMLSAEEDEEAQSDSTPSEAGQAPGPDSQEGGEAEPGQKPQSPAEDPNAG